MLFAGILWFLPSIDSDNGYSKAYDGFTGTEIRPSGSPQISSSSQRNITPTPGSKITLTTVVGYVGQKNSSLNITASKNPSDDPSPQRGSPSDADEFRRNKVVQVRHGQQMGNSISLFVTSHR